MRIGRRIAVLAATALLGAGVAVLAPANPASATWVCAGVGTATTSPTYYPIGTATVTTSTQPHVGVFWRIGASEQKTFFFSFTPGLGACANPETTDTSKTISATGTFLGWCGLSSGHGVTGNGASFSWIGVGGLLIITGHLVGVVNAVPDVAAGQSCTPTGSGATLFRVQGVVVLFHCSALGTTLPLPNVGLITNGLIDHLASVILTTVPVGPALFTVHIWVHAQAHLWVTTCTPDPLLTL